MKFYLIIAIQYKDMKYDNDGPKSLTGNDQYFLT